MKNVWKKLWLFGMILAAGIQLTACGGKDAGENGAGTKKDYVYVPEYKTLPEGLNISSVAIGGESIYYTGWTHNKEKDEYKNTLGVMPVGSTETKALPVELGENENVSAISASPDGSLCLILQSDAPGEAEGEFIQAFVLKKLDKDGNIRLEKNLSELMRENEVSYIQYMAQDNDDNIYLCNGDNQIFVLDSEGNMLFDLKTDSYIQSLGKTKEGMVVAAVFGKENMELLPVDTTKKAFGTPYKDIPSNGRLTIVEGIDKGSMISSGNSVYAYHYDGQEAEEILNWLDSDLDSDAIITFAGLPDGRILAVHQNRTEENSSTDMIYLTKKPASEVAEKTILTYGTMYMNSEVRSAIIQFNKTNETYRIQAKEYGANDYETSLTQMNSDITSGNAPDIIDLLSLNTAMYASKGLLEDLYPYMEKDPEIKKENYFENVLKALEIEGKLYSITPGFNISTLIGRESDVGSEMGWTLEEMMAFADSIPEGTELMDYATKSSILADLCNFAGTEFVDWNTGKCSFDTEEFIKILEFANRFPKEFEYQEDEESMPSKIRNKKLFLTSIYATDVQEYQMYEAMYGEPITFIGYPAKEGIGAGIGPSSLMASISSKSKNKDGAWEFIKMFLLEDYQKKNIRWNFPVSKAAFDDMLTEAMTPEYETDENGQQVEKMKTSWGYDDFEVDIYAASQEQTDKVKALVTSVSTLKQTNNELINIIYEEAAPFFEGQKNAKEVADIIQSRVQIYVNENR